MNREYCTRDIKYWVQGCPKEAVDYVLEDAYQKRAHYDKLISSLETIYPEAA